MYSAQCTLYANDYNVYIVKILSDFTCTQLYDYDLCLYETCKAGCKLHEYVSCIQCTLVHEYVSCIQCTLYSVHKMYLFTLYTVYCIVYINTFYYNV